jgi:FdrA protein
MVLMQVAAELRALSGVREAAALMGTPANHDVLEAAGLATAETRTAAAGDLLLAVDADTDAAAEAALAAGVRRLDERREARERTGRAPVRTLDGAVRQMPEANLALISVPGAYAKLEAMAALRRGLHVFLFSDNVPVADEVELKRVAVQQRLLCMGPDCGTAYVSGVGLGFANVVPRGRIGCVAASGTGLQAVASGLAALGEGISHGLGVGGRDLSAEVGGAMTELALEALAADPETEAVVVVSKPPAPSVLPTLEKTLASVRKPVVVCCLGATPGPGAPGTWVTTLDDAAAAAVAAVRGQRWTPRPFGDPVAVRARLTTLQARGGVLGLYSGGTLAHEAHLVLEPLLGAIPHRLVDLGDDEYTRGRPHPMIDPSLREAMVREAGGDRGVGVLLLDLVLGRAAHPDPAGRLAPAVRDAHASARRDGRALLVVASIVGTEHDPQGLTSQRAALASAGVVVLPSNAEAARFAAVAVVPDLAARLLGDAR